MRTGPSKAAAAADCEWAREITPPKAAANSRPGRQRTCAIARYLSDACDHRPTCPAIPRYSETFRQILNFFHPAVMV